VLTDRLLGAIASRYLGKPDLAEFLRIRFPDLPSLLSGTRNEVAHRLGWDGAARLTTLNVELTSRCNAACSYCDVNRQLGRPNRDLDLSLYARLLESSPTLEAVLPFQWGEPLLYPALDEALDLATRRGLRSYLTTNGLLLDGDRFRLLAATGLNRLTVSIDGDASDHQARRGYDQAAVLEQLAEARHAQARDGLKTKLDISMVVDESVAASMPAFRERLSPLCDRLQFIPRMIQGERTHGCREPSRGLLVVLSDGSVTTCCADVRGELALGHLDDGDPAALYNGPRWRALRKQHRNGDLPPTCKNCSECNVSGVSPRFS
jgi:radical SAM protein with 4Fe4S-binding SPASM domain